jgi:anti-sigma B factor antagonist
MPSNRSRETPEPATGQCFRAFRLPAARVRPMGELDLATVPVLVAELAGLRHAGVRVVILDLSALDFIDSSGLRCILEYDAEARRNGCSIALVRGPDAVQRVFRITDTEARLPFIRA